LRRSFALVTVLWVVAGVLLSGCAAPKQTSTSTLAMAPMSGMPKEVQAAPARVRSAYQFAVANPDALKNVPCYCGCGAMGHTSNLSCYIKERKADGQIVFDNHALGCSLCVDISQDVMRMTGEGKSPQDIHTAILAAYSKFGPPNQ
jgi:hypothetical protein